MTSRVHRLTQAAGAALAAVLTISLPMHKHPDIIGGSQIQSAMMHAADVGIADPNVRHPYPTEA